MTSLGLIASGYALPSGVIENDVLAPKLGETSEAIIAKCGVEKRYWINEHESLVGLAEHASKNALTNIDLNEIDHLFFSTQTPELLVPGTGCLLQHKLGLTRSHSIDVRAQCLGWIQSLQLARALAQAGTLKKALIVCAETHSLGLDISPTGAETSMIFGDGAVATVFEVEAHKNQLRDVVCRTDGSHWDQLYCGLSYRNRKKEQGDFPAPVMHGKNVMLIAVRKIKDLFAEVLQKHQLTLADLDLVLFHQANLHLLKYIQKTLKLSDEQVWFNIQNYGNLSSASIPLSFHEAERAGRLKKGSKVLTIAYGSGFQWGAGLFEV